MRTYVRARRPSVQANQPVRFVQDPTFYVQQATMIPDGMHGVQPTNNNLAIESTMKKLIAGGVHPERAQQLVKNAYVRVNVWPNTNRGLHLGLAKRLGARPHRRAGLGDDELVGPSLPEDALLNEVRSKAADIQRQHADLIAKIPAGKASGDLLRIRNLIDALYVEWTDYAVGVKNGVPPYQWDRTNPIDAIMIAVRDDLRDTVNAIDANKAQEVLTKQVLAVTPKTGFPSFGINVPWYVWAGGAAAGAAVLGKTLHLW